MNSRAKSRLFSFLGCKRRCLINPNFRYVFSERKEIKKTQFISLDIEGGLSSDQNKFADVIQVSLTTYSKSVNALFVALHEAFPDCTTLIEKTSKFFDKATEYSLEVQDCTDAIRILKAVFVYANKFDYIFVAHWAAFDFSQLCNYYPYLRNEIIELYKNNRVTCTKLRETLISIGTGRYEFDFRFNRKAPSYSLNMLSKVYLDMDMGKKAIQVTGEVSPSANFWRINYLHLSYHNLHTWPTSAVDYAADDTSVGLAVAIKQTKYSVQKSPGGDIVYSGHTIPDEFRQARGDFALNVAAGSGFTRDKETTIEFIEKSVEKVVQLFPFEMTLGLRRGSEPVSYDRFEKYMTEFHEELWDNMDDDLKYYYEFEIFPALITACEEDKNKNKINTFRKVALQTLVRMLFDYFKLDYQVTKKGIQLIAERVISFRTLPTQYIQCNKDSLGMIPCPVIAIYNNSRIYKSLVASFVPIVRDRLALIANINALLATGRVSMTTPPLQTAPREGGFRECMSVNEGEVLNVADFTTNELRTLAEVCYHYFGYSILGDSINAGMDPHCKMGSELIGMDYDDFMHIRNSGPKHAKYKEVDNARQTGKIGNFGGPGGLGPDSFVKFARQNYKTIIQRDTAEYILKTFKNLFYEIKDLFKAIGKITASGLGDIVQLYSNRVRASIKFTQACNTTFQGLAADGAKACAFAIVAACLVRTEGYEDIYDSNARLIGFVHDEFISKGPDANTSWAVTASRLQEEVMHEWTPHVKSEAEPTLCYRYSKAAKKKVDSEGRLIAYDSKPNNMFKHSMYKPPYQENYELEGGV